jgi:hypothetical protein
MRAALIFAIIIGMGGAAMAAEDLPTLQQCKSGWKSKYRSVWKESYFKRACSEILKTAKS